jgi:hypothetical protein
MGGSTVRRAVIGVAWIFVGLALTYGALLLFTPYGLPIIAGCHLVGRALATIDARRVRERIGLIAAPGVGCLIIASRTTDLNAWAFAGAALIGAAFIGRLLSPSTQ